ncbi:MAG TPA: putative DNA binding domain-containing protein [Bacteroidales bacterium]|nr:putative DNA binding domain-containing protein [Bacteroidales bacterium]HRX95425.1 putative DNA binding domain-containing protein [Bacteroidales bacterium]
MTNILDRKHIDFLKEVSIFSKLSDDEIKSIAPLLFIKEIEEGQNVFARFENEQVLYIVRYGKLVLETSLDSESILKKGDVFGEIAVINNHYRTGTIKAAEPTLLFGLHGNDLFQKIPAETAIKVVVEMAKLISSYLTTAQNTSTATLIENGESEFVEFKSTLRYNLHTNKFDKNIEHAALKTIAAFLNSAGGTLLVGVDDHKNLLGLGKDNFKDDDHMLLHLTKMIQERIGIKQTQYVRAIIETKESLKILRIDVRPSTSPAYLEHNGEEYLYVRTGPATTRMNVSEVYTYIKSRFFSKG